MDIIIYFLNFYIKELIEDFNDFIKDANKYPAGKENIAEIIEKQLRKFGDFQNYLTIYHILFNFI